MYGFITDINLLSYILNVYGKCENIDDSRKLFDYMNELCSYGNQCEVCYFFKTMRGQVCKLAP